MSKETGASKEGFTNPSHTNQYCRPVEENRVQIEFLTTCHCRDCAGHVCVRTTTSQQENRTETRHENPTPKKRKKRRRGEGGGAKDASAVQGASRDVCAAGVGSCGRGVCHCGQHHAGHQGAGGGLVWVALPPAEVHLRSRCPGRRCARGGCR